MRIVILGYIVRGPIGGMTWHYLHYILGLKDLGHEVFFLEDSDNYPSCYDPSKNVTSIDPTYGLEYTENIFRHYNLEDQWAYYDSHNNCWMGGGFHRVIEFVKSAELLINVSGKNPWRSWLDHIPYRALIDTDPAFTQVDINTNDRMRKMAASHNSCFSFGENIGEENCTVPTDGIDWMPTRQPLFLKEWPAFPPSCRSSFTTIMQWESYKIRRYKGRDFGMKSVSFKEYLELPKKTDATLEIALGGSGAPRGSLVANGWNLKNPLEITRDIWSYQKYIQQSKAEFSVAKNGYVTTNSGWFSERSAAYLASGRPVVLQETGFSNWMDVGEGVVSFRNAEEAIDALDAIITRYNEHCLAARNIAEEYFDSNRVLAELIDRATST